MSAVLSAEDIQPVADLLEKLQNVQRAIKDLHDAEADEPSVKGNEYGVCISLFEPTKECSVAHTHRLSYWVVQQGLAAMERELRAKLEGTHEITVESVLPIKEHA